MHTMCSLLRVALPWRLSETALPMRIRRASADETGPCRTLLRCLLSNVHYKLLIVVISIVSVLVLVLSV